MSEEKITGNITLKEEQLAELNTQLDTYYNQSTGYQEGELGSMNSMKGWIMVRLNGLQAGRAIRNSSPSEILNE